MVDLPPAARSDFLCDIHAEQEAEKVGTTQDARQQKIYKQWRDLCSTLLINPALQYPLVPCIKALQVYRHRVQHNH